MFMGNSRRTGLISGLGLCRIYIKAIYSSLGTYNQVSRKGLEVLREMAL